MFKLEVIKYKGFVPLQPISAEFNKLGGGIGRGDTNVLVLPDAERYISRTHAKIVFRDGFYVIEDHGTSSPVMINGRVVGKGNDAVLANGDEIAIGEYLLRTVVQDDDFPEPANENSGKISVTSLKDDPMLQFGARGSSDPFADLIPPSRLSAKVSEVTSPAAFDDPFGLPAKNHQAAAIPDDFDPFANLGSPSGKSVENAGLSDNPDYGLGGTLENQSLDDIFGLNPSSKSDFLSPLGPLAEPADAVALEISPSLDPMAAFSEKATTTSASSQRNDTPEIYGSFTPPKGFLDPAMAKQAHSPEIAIPEESHGDMILSWNKDGSAAGDIKTVVSGPIRNKSPIGGQEKNPPLEHVSLSDRKLSHVHVPETNKSEKDAALESVALKEQAEFDPAAPVQVKVAQIAPGSVPQTKGTPRMPSEAVSATRPPGHPTQDAFITAFLEGAGIADFNIPSGFTPQTMHMLGQILRESVQGTLDLLLARAMLKREIRADVTMIVAKENNPLKFSPNVEAALAHLLAPQRGFIPPLEAMEDAWDDLRSHQFAFMAGMREALAGTLSRFNPEQLEQRLTQKTVLDSLLPINRKAKLWDLFVDLYSDISREAEDDFHALFGREFLRAYEAQIEKLRRHQETEGKRS